MTDNCSSIPIRSRDFSPLPPQPDQLHPTYQMSTGSYFPGIKWPGHDDDDDDDHSLPSSTEVKNAWRFTSISYFCGIVHSTKQLYLQQNCHHT